MKLYIASAFSNQAEVKAAMNTLRAAGYQITHDWTQENADHLTPGSDSYFEFLEDCGRADYAGVMQADAVLLLNNEKCKDSFAELGMGIGAGKACIVVNPKVKHSVFFGLCTKADTLADAIRHLDEFRAGEEKWRLFA